MPIAANSFVSISFANRLTILEGFFCFRTLIPYIEISGSAKNLLAGFASRFEQMGELFMELG